MLTINLNSQTKKNRQSIIKMSTSVFVQLRCCFQNNSHVIFVSLPMKTYVDLVHKN